VPSPNDVRLLQVAVARGLITQSIAGACLAELQAAEREGKALRAAQVLMRRQLLSSTQMVGLVQQAQDVGSSSQQVVGSSTAMGMALRSDEAAAQVKGGDALAGYTLVRELGRGAVGILFEAHHPSQPRAAIKVLSIQASRSEEIVRRFKLEAETLSTLEHPALVKVRGAGSANGVHYLVMDFIAGKTLADLARAGQLPPRKALEVVADVALACAYLHGRGVVHRDIKPANIMVRRSERSGFVPTVSEAALDEAVAATPAASAGRVVLVDFGLAKDTMRRDIVATQMGKFIGTPAYMSPEQARGDPRAVGPPTDVYALGAVLFRCISGRYPFAEASFLETLSAIATRPAPSLAERRPDASPALVQLVAEAMAHDPRARPTAAQLAERIATLLAQGVLMPPAPLTRTRKRHERATSARRHRGDDTSGAVRTPAPGSMRRKGNESERFPHA
jgi:serine/threonine protein kinase